MSDVIEEKQYQLDWLKWLVVAVLVVGAIYGNWYYSGESVLYRVLALLVVAVVSGLIAARTKKGAAVVGLAIGARTEWRKVVWPTKQERNQTTLIVVVVILLMAIALWGIDSFLSWIASIVMG